MYNIHITVPNTEPALDVLRGVQANVGLTPSDEVYQFQEMSVTYHATLEDALSFMLAVKPITKRVMLTPQFV